MRQLVELSEYGTARLRVPDPSAADLVLAERLMSGGDLGRRIEVRFMARGLMDVIATSWIGVVRFSNVEIRVVPKLVGGQLRVLQMLEVSHGVHLLRRLPPGQKIAADGANLFDLIVMLLAKEVRDLLRDGLIRDYRSIDSTLKTLRGRLRLRDQFARHYGSFHQVECTFDEYDGDTAENQLMAAALAAAVYQVEDHSLLAEARSLARTLSEVCTPPTTDPAWYERRIHYGRRNSRYRSAHRLSVLVLEGLALDNLYDTTSDQVGSFMLDMNALFERFVSRLITDSLEGQAITVSTQPSFDRAILDENTNLSYGRIRPDLVLTDNRTGQTTPVDIKYKLYDLKKISPGDIYQAFLYAQVLGPDSSTATAGLIYPATAAISGPLIQIARADRTTVANIRGVGLNVSALLANLAEGDQQVAYDAVSDAIQVIACVSQTTH